MGVEVVVRATEERGAGARRPHRGAGEQVEPGTRRIRVGHPRGDDERVAVGVGALVGMLVATLIASRLRRIARTAATIEAGAFDVELKPHFHDDK